MKMILLFILMVAWCYASAQDSSVCVQVDCKDTLKYPQDTLILNGTATAVGGIKTIKWTVAKGTASIDNAGVAPALARKFSNYGYYVFTLTATSAYGFVGSAYDTTYYIDNKAPTAIVGAAQTVKVSTFVLSGSKSTDPEGLPLTYSWVETSGPKVVTINTSTMSNPLVTGLVNGDYAFTLTVRDSGGLTNSAIQKVKVIGNPK